MHERAFKVRDQTGQYALKVEGVDEKVQVFLDFLGRASKQNRRRIMTFGISLLLQRDAEIVAYCKQMSRIARHILSHILSEKRSLK